MKGLLCIYFFLSLFFRKEYFVGFRFPIFSLALFLKEKKKTNQKLIRENNSKFALYELIRNNNYQLSPALIYYLKLFFFNLHEFIYRYFFDHIQKQQQRRNKKIRSIKKREKRRRKKNEKLLLFKQVKYKKKERCSYSQNRS